MNTVHSCVRRSVFAALGALAIVIGSRSAAAAPSAADKLTAKALFDAGRALTKANNFADACPKLQESQQLDPSLVTEFFLADCYEHTGRLATAWIYYEDVATQASAAGQRDRGTFARDRADAVKPRVPKLTIEVPAKMKDWPDLEIKRDRSVVSQGQWGVSVAVDPASYSISANAKGKKRWTMTIELKEGRSETVKVPILEDEAAPIAQLPPPEPVAPPPPVKPIAKTQVAPPKAPSISRPIAKPVQGRTGTTQRTTGIVVGAAGLVGLGIGAGFGALAMSKQSASKAPGRCDAQSNCDLKGRDLRYDAFRAANASTIGVVVGTVVLAGGIVLVTTAPKLPRSTTLSLGPGSLSLTGRW